MNEKPPGDPPGGFCFHFCVRTKESEQGERLFVFSCHKDIFGV